MSREFNDGKDGRDVRVVDAAPAAVPETGAASGRRGYPVLIAPAGGGGVAAPDMTMAFQAILLSPTRARARATTATRSSSARSGSRRWAGVGVADGARQGRGVGDLPSWPQPAGWVLAGQPRRQRRQRQGDEHPHQAVPRQRPGAPRRAMVEVHDVLLLQLDGVRDVAGDHGAPHGEERETNVEKTDVWIETL
ncbi:hypothetical protein ACP4OV_001577 [Aristida adscensionis]